MKEKLFLLFLGCLIPLFCTITEPVTFEIETGYREDYLNWKSLTDDDLELLEYKETYKGLQYWQSNLLIRSITRDFYLEVEGGYGGLINGDMHQKYANQSFTNDDFKASYNVIRGNDWNAEGVIGMLVNLTPERFTKLILIPKLGYSSWWRIIYTDNPSPLSLTVSDNIYDDDSIIVFSMNRRRLKQVWYGPTIGGGLQINPNNKVILKANYMFHWMKVDNKAEASYRRYYDSEDHLADIMENFHADDIKAYGHVGKISASYGISDKFRLGIGARFQYYSSYIRNYTYEKFETMTQENSLRRYVSRWWYISGFITAGIAF